MPRRRDSHATFERLKTGFTQFWVRRSLRSMTAEERHLLTEAQVGATRSIISGVLASGAMILAITGAFEGMRLVPGIGYPWWMIELVAVTVAAISAAVWLLDDWRVRLVLMLLATILVGVFLSIPLPDAAAQTAIRAGLFQLLPIALLVLLARPLSLASIVAAMLGMAWLRAYLHGDPSSGSALYWLFNLTSIAFGLLLAGYKTDFAVAVFRMQMKLRQQAMTDELTGLFNRAGWNEESTAAYENAVSRGQTISLAFFDIDHFKAVNDTYGHEAGDQVLQVLGRILKSRIGSRTCCARLGGEEFIVLLISQPPEAVEGFVQRVRREFEEEVRDKRVTVSAGVAHRQPGESFSHHLRRADTALYAAKREGRNRMVVSEVEG